MRLAAAAAIVLLAGAASAAPQTPKLDLTQFFSGRSHADNVLKIAFHDPAKLIVDSVGGKGDRGDFVLVDTVHEGDKPVRTRKWVMQPAGPNHFTGSLTDAVGPVDIVVNGDAATIRYTMKNRMTVEQWLSPAGEKTVRNRMKVRRLGLVVAHFDETIRKLD